MKIDTKKERDYGKAAWEHIRRKQQTQLPVIKSKTQEWIAWRRYFVDHLGFLPYVMQRIEHEFSSDEMTVPAELPEQFDPSYAAAIELKRKLDEKAS